MTDTFPAHTVETAPEEVSDALAATIGKIGFLPSMMGKLAEAPVLLRGYQPFFAAGYTPRQAPEVILSIALKVIANYTNALASSPPNAEFGEDVWQRRRERSRTTAGMSATESRS